MSLSDVLFHLASFFFFLLSVFYLRLLSAYLLRINKNVFLSHLFSGSRIRAANAIANSATKESADSNSAPVDDANDVERLDRLSKEIECFLIGINH